MQQNLWPIAIPLALIPLLLLALWRIGLKKLQGYHSPILGKVEVFQKYNGEKTLTINSYVQGISIDKKSVEQSYWFRIAESVINYCQPKDEAQIVMLGLGANTIPNLIAQINPQIHQTIIEVDKYIIQACRKFFNLDRLPNYRLIRADAYKLFEQKDNPLRTFDVMIVDIFIGRPPYISLKSNEPSYIEQILPHLKNDGMIIFNRPAHTPEARSEGEKLKVYLDNLFQKTEVFDIKDPRGFRNYVITASVKR